MVLHSPGSTAERWRELADFDCYRIEVANELDWLEYRQEVGCN